MGKGFPNKPETVTGERGYNILIEYLGNFHAIIFIALNNGIVMLGGVQMDDSLNVTRQRIMKTYFCSPSLLFKYDVVILGWTGEACQKGRKSGEGKV